MRPLLTLKPVIPTVDGMLSVSKVSEEFFGFKMVADVRIHSDEVTDDGL